MAENDNRPVRPTRWRWWFIGVSIPLGVLMLVFGVLIGFASVESGQDAGGLVAALELVGLMITSNRRR